MDDTMRPMTIRTETERHVKGILKAPTRSFKAKLKRVVPRTRIRFTPETKFEPKKLKIKNLTASARRRRLRGATEEYSSCSLWLKNVDKQAKFTRYLRKTTRSQVGILLFIVMMVSLLAIVGAIAAEDTEQYYTMI